MGSIQSKTICAIAAATAGWAGVSEAALVTYSPQAGTTVNFISISESSAEPTSLGNALYNQPTAAGDTLVFSELNFRAQSTGPNRDLNFVDFVDGQLNVTIAAKPLNYLTDLTISEFGDYTLQLGGIVPGAAYASVTVPSLFVVVLERNGVAITPVQVNGSMTWAAPGREFFRNVPSFSDTTPASGVFAGSGTIDLVAATGFSDITKIAFNYNNQLYAESLPNASAAIAKKGVSLDVDSVAVPEPTFIVGAGVIGGMLVLRRRRA